MKQPTHVCRHGSILKAKYLHCRRRGVSPVIMPRHWAHTDTRRMHLRNNYLNKQVLAGWKTSSSGQNAWHGNTALYYHVWCNHRYYFSHIHIWGVLVADMHKYYVCDCRRGFGLSNGFIDHLYTPLGTASNYRAISNLHNSQHPLSHFLVCCLHQPFPGNGL
jgi:hypothetical protein